MSSKIHHYSEMPGTKDLYVLLDVINNKDKYKKILDELEKARENANEAIQNVGLTGDIKQLKSLAESDRLQAQHELQNARDEADHILSEAKGILEKTNEECANKIEELNKNKIEFTNEMQITLSELKEKEDNLDKEKESVNLLKAQLEEQQKQIDKEREDVAEKRRILSESLEKTR